MKHVRVDVDSCADCGHLIVVQHDSPGFRTTKVPGTGRMDCLHGYELIGRVVASALVHAALSTVLRSYPALGTQADMCHVLQDWLNIPTGMSRVGVPSRLLTDHGVSSDGLATARIVAKVMGGLPGVPDRDRLYWQAAVNILRVRI